MSLCSRQPRRQQEEKKQRWAWRHVGQIKSSLRRTSEVFRGASAAYAVERFAPGVRPGVHRPRSSPVLGEAFFEGKAQARRAVHRGDAARLGNGHHDVYLYSSHGGSANSTFVLRQIKPDEIDRTRCDRNMAHIEHAVLPKDGHDHFCC